MPYQRSRRDTCSWDINIALFLSAHLSLLSMQAQTNFYIIVKSYMILLLNGQLHSNQTPLLHCFDNGTARRSESGLNALFHSKRPSWTQEDSKGEKI